MREAKLYYKVALPKQSKPDSYAAVTANIENEKSTAQKAKYNKNRHTDKSNIGGSDDRLSSSDSLPQNNTQSPSTLSISILSKNTQ